MNNLRKQIFEEEFPFLKNISNENYPYYHWGLEFMSGWDDLFRECLTLIQEIYQHYHIDNDFVIIQVKEKVGKLVIRYGFTSPQTSSICHSEIEKIILNTQDKSLHVCEKCGQQGNLRKDLKWIRVLCDTCYQSIDARLKKDSFK